MSELLAALALPVAVTLAILFLRRRTVVVQRYEAGLLTRNGRFVRVLGAGRHRLYRSGTTIEVVDLRTTLCEATGQEVPTKDRASVKVSAVLRYRVVDARAWIEGSTSSRLELHVALQIALRTAAAQVDLETLLVDRASVHEQVLAEIRSLGARIGVEAESVALKDVAAAGDLKRALADEVKAQAEGRAKLARARAETAALRNLVNAARLVRENVGLYELRLLETASHAADRPGNSLLLGLSKDVLDRGSNGKRAG